MKRKVSLAILGTMLQGSAHAVESSTTNDHAPSKETVTHSPQVTEKKPRAARVKKVKPNMQVETTKIDSQINLNKDTVTENPPGLNEESIQLRGVRG